MNQLNMLYEPLYIPGLRYIPKYITKEQELDLVKIIDMQVWSKALKRRVQHYGYEYNYKNRSIDSAEYLGMLPNWLEDIAKQLYSKNICKNIPNQIIINEYMPGQGINEHIDCIACFEDTICSLSLASHCVMDLTQNMTKESILLEPCSLLVLQCDARYLWKHAIAARKYDKYQNIIYPRERRISLTFRTIKN